MKEGIVHGGPPCTINIIDTPIPTPGPDEILIKIIYAGSNPKDWKYPHFSKQDANSGDDMAGYVERVGSEVYEFRAGDRVAAFHVMRSAHGSFAEYGIAPARTTFHLPDGVGFAEAATVPLAGMTAAVGLFANLRVAVPWAPVVKGEGEGEGEVPLIVYGASSAVGAFAIKLAVRSNIHPIIAVAGKGREFVEGIVDAAKGDIVLDYRVGPEKLVQEIRGALRGRRCLHAFDAISEHGSPEVLGQVLADGGHVTFVLPNLDFSSVPERIVTSITYVGLVHTGEQYPNKSVRYVNTVNGLDFGYVYFRLFGQGLKDGWFKPHPHQVIPGGLKGVPEGLTNLREGKASAVKYVFKIEDTP